MQPKVSLLSSQQPATGPYPKPDESSPHLSCSAFNTIFMNAILIHFYCFQIFELAKFLRDLLAVIEL
jgi:hypothetical protein